LGQLFLGENKLESTFENEKKLAFLVGFLFVLLYCWNFFVYCFWWWLMVVLLVVCCFRNWDAEIRRRNLHEAFGRKLMQNRHGENYSRNFGPILVKLASNKQTKLDRLGKLL